MAATFETRLLTVDSSQRLSSAQTTTQFSISMLNAPTTIRERVIGCSVEHLSFQHLINNVTADLSRMTVTYYDGVSETTFTLVIPPGNYDYVDLAAVLELEFGLQVFGFPGALTVTAVAEALGQPALLEFEFTEVAPNYLTIHYDRVGLAYPIGMSESITLTALGGPVSFRPNLQGPIALLLKSRALMGSKSSYSGIGATETAFLTVPITVSYGSVQSLHIQGENRPNVLYSHERSLTEIDIALTHLDGSNVNLGTGEMSVSVRLWLKHVS